MAATTAQLSAQQSSGFESKFGALSETEKKITEYVQYDHSII